MTIGLSENRIGWLSKLLGPDRQKWKKWDVLQLLGDYKGPSMDILIDQGLADPFLGLAMQPGVSVVNLPKTGFNCELRMHRGYDHGMNFVGTFVGDHIEFHARHLLESKKG